MKTLLSALTALLLFNLCAAQNLVRKFEAPYTYTNYLMSRSIMVDGGKAVVAVGCTSPGKDRYSGNALIVKTRLDGTVLFNEEHTYNDGFNDVKSNYVSVVEHLDRFGNVSYVGMGNAINSNNLLLAKTDALTGTVTNSTIINPALMTTVLGTDSIYEYSPIKILHDKSNDQFLCIVNIKQYSYLPVGPFERICILVFDNNLNFIEIKIYRYGYNSGEIVRVQDALIYANAVTGADEIAIIGSIGHSHSLLSLNSSNPNIPPVINPLYNHDAGFLARLRVPRIGNSLPAVLDMHFYPFLYAPTFAEGLWFTSFTHYDNGANRGFYIAGFRDVLLTQTEPVIFEVDEMGNLQNTFPISTALPAGNNKHDIITSIHYDKDELIMTGGRYESPFSHNLYSFNEFNAFPFREVYAKSWLMDLKFNTISSWNYGALNNFSDTVGWSTSSVYDESSKLTYLSGNYINNTESYARGFLLIDDLKNNTGCYKADDEAGFGSGVFLDTTLVLEGLKLHDDSAYIHSVVSNTLRDNIVCTNESAFYKTSPFDQSPGKSAPHKDAVVTLTVYDLSGRLIIKDAQVTAGNQADAAIRKYLSSEQQLNKHQVYIVHYQSKGETHRLKLVIR